MRTIEFRVYTSREGMLNNDIDCFININRDGTLNNTGYPANHVNVFTGFLDKHNNKIFEGDILSDYTQIDEGVIKSHRQVFWCEKTGAWMLDESYIQDKSASRLLSKELEEFDYEISGNIHENPELLQATEMKRTRE